MADIPTTRYVKSDVVHVAYQVIGEGPVDVLWVPGFVSHMEAGWQNPQGAALLRRLSSFCRLTSQPLMIAHGLIRAGVCTNPKVLELIEATTATSTRRSDLDQFLAWRQCLSLNY
jgi:hypothetical protein